VTAGGGNPKFQARNPKKKKLAIRSSKFETEPLNVVIAIYLLVGLLGVNAALLVIIATLLVIGVIRGR
jgi:hypothetical protein